jgi:hypothetical protein
MQMRYYVIKKRKSKVYLNHKPILNSKWIFTDTKYHMNPNDMYRRTYDQNKWKKGVP